MAFKAQSTQHPVDHSQHLEYLLTALTDVEPASLGHYLEAALPCEIKALTPHHQCLGRALTVYQPTNDATPVHLALELLQPGDVLVIDRARQDQVACVGEMVATAAHLKGAHGIIVNGVVTDLEAISHLGIAIYAKGTSVITTRATYEPGAQLAQTITIGDVSIKTGDIILADRNGILSIDPNNTEIISIIEQAQADERKEVEWKRRLADGHSLADLNEIDRNRFEAEVCPLPKC